MGAFELRCNGQVVKSVTLDKWNPKWIHTAGAPQSICCDCGVVFAVRRSSGGGHGIPC